MRIYRTLNQVLLAGSACAALFTAAPVAWSSPVGPSLTTTTNPSAVTLTDSSVTITDTAELSGGFDPTGSLTFMVAGPGSLSFTDTDTVTGNGTFTADITLPTSGTVVGEYTWFAQYSGDPNNSGVSSFEVASVSAASPVSTPRPHRGAALARP
jgi:hypothetical protein